MRNDDARIHTRRRNRDGRASGTRRRDEAFDRWYAEAEAKDPDSWLSQNTARFIWNAAWEAQAGNQSLDGLHPRDEG